MTKLYSDTVPAYRVRVGDLIVSGITGSPDRVFGWTVSKVEDRNGELWFHDADDDDAVPYGHNEFVSVIRIRDTDNLNKCWCGLPEGHYHA